MAEETGQSIYDESIVIDGLNVSRWDSTHVYDSLEAGGVTAIKRDHRRVGGIPRDDGQRGELASPIQGIRKYPDSRHFGSRHHQGEGREKDGGRAGLAETPPRSRIAWTGWSCSTPSACALSR